MSKIAETMVIDVLLLEKSLINCKKMYFKGGKILIYVDFYKFLDIG